MLQKMNVNTKFSKSQIALFLFLAIMTVIQVFPLIWLADFSLLRNGDLFGPDILKMPNPPEWSNYVKAWTDGRIPVYLFNSSIIVISTVFISCLFSFLAAYACTRMEWKGRYLIYTIILLGMTIPIHTTLLPNFILFKFFRLIDTRLGVIIAYVAFNISFNTFVFSGFLQGIPRAVEESAFIDGAGVFTITMKIIAPMSITAFIPTGVLTFLNGWNEYIMANTYISTEKLRTLPFSIINFSGRFASQYAAQFACMMLIAIPPIVLFLFFNKYIISGITAGAIKG